MSNRRSPGWLCKNLTGRDEALILIDHRHVTITVCDFIILRRYWVDNMSRKKHCGRGDERDINGAV